MLRGSASRADAPVRAAHSNDSSSRRGDWLRVLLLVLALRLLLNVPALLAANSAVLDQSSGVPEMATNPASFPGVWIRWDSGYYLSIAQHGYSHDESHINFWPLYPLAIRVLSIGTPSLMPWAAVTISILALAVANVLLWQLTRADIGERAAWGTIIALNLFPTALFFSAAYAESLFLLFSVLVYWFAAHRRYWLAALFVALASVTRIYGILLLILLLTEMVSAQERVRPRKVVLIALATSSLLLIWGGLLWLTHGSPFASVASQTDSFARSVTVPGLSLIHGIAVAALGYGGFGGNWFMRVASAYDSLAAMLFATASIGSFWVLPRRSLRVYSAVAMLALMIAHGPHALGVYSMSRYVLALFPAFMVIELWLERVPRVRSVAWIGMGCAQCAMVAWFSTGRWVA